MECSYISYKSYTGHKTSNKSSYGGGGQISYIFIKIYSLNDFPISCMKNSDLSYKNIKNSDLS